MSANDRAWLDHAKCKGMNPAVFVFFTDGKELHEARAKAVLVCAVCPVRDQCLQWAIDHNETGIWGGLTDGQRADLRFTRRQPHGMAGAA